MQTSTPPGSRFDTCRDMCVYYVSKKIKIILHLLVPKKNVITVINSNVELECHFAPPLYYIRSILTIEFKDELKSGR